MPGTLYSGLCSTCKHASTCAFPGDPRRPLFYCDEFELEVTSPSKAGPAGMSQSTGPFIPEIKGSAALIGLCWDCENSPTCIFPIPEGGRWHCEEYR